MKLLNKKNKKNILDDNIRLEDLEYYNNNNSLNIYYLYNRVQFLYVALSKVLESMYDLGVDTDKLEDETINIHNTLKEDIENIKSNNLKNDYIIKDIFEKMEEYSRTINKKKKGK